MKSTFIAPSVESSPGEFPVDTDLSFGAYKQDGEIYVFVDSHTPSKLSDYTTKQAAYEYRLSIGMSHSGIGAFGIPFMITEKDHKTTLTKTAAAGKVKPVWRQLFKLTPML